MGKISAIKRKNIKGGKLSKGKKTTNKHVTKARRRLALMRKLKLKNKDAAKGKAQQDDDIVAGDMLDMLDKEELTFIQSRDRIRHPESIIKIGAKAKKRKLDDEDELLENQYESLISKKAQAEKKIRPLLPIKTRRGLEMQFTEEERYVVPRRQENEFSLKNSSLPESTDLSKLGQKQKDTIKPGQVVSRALLVARRRQRLLENKIKIGILSASFLEDPENRMKNLDSLLAMLVTPDTSVPVSVPKLCALSLNAVFDDALPSYFIKHTNPEGTKMKLETRELQNHEATLLRRYRMYLQRLEKLVQKYLPRKKSQSSSFSGAEAKFGQVALICLCKMLQSHPYFNYSVNIVNFVIPFLNYWNPEVRNIVSESIKGIFAIDKRGEISYEIVRRINVLVKAKIGSKKSGFLRKDVIDVLLGLRIKEADIEKEKEEEMKPKKRMTFEQRKMLSKRGRKKAKEMVLLEKELLEASAEENKVKKSHFLTEITKIVFTIYFRALKSESCAALLSPVLEGLGKFAHVISIDYFDDLLKVLNRLQAQENLSQRERLLCIVTVLSVLDGHGSALALDPTAFHKRLYAQLINLRCGKVESDVTLALRSVHLAMKKKMPGPRAAAFVKRLATVALQLDNEAMLCLMEMKQITRTHSSVKSLLDSEGSIASGVYLPELEDPDHAMAQTSTLWELTTLSNHYSPLVREAAKSIISSAA